MSHDPDPGPRVSATPTPTPRKTRPVPEPSGPKPSGGVHQRSRVLLQPEPHLPPRVERVRRQCRPCELRQKHGHEQVTEVVYRQELERQCRACREDEGKPDLPLVAVRTSACLSVVASYPGHRDPEFLIGGSYPSSDEERRRGRSKPRGSSGAKEGLLEEGTEAQDGKPDVPCRTKGPGHFQGGLRRDEVPCVSGVRTGGTQQGGMVPEIGDTPE